MNKIFVIMLFGLFVRCGFYVPNGSIPANVLSITPANAASSVSETTSITIVFSQAMDTDTITTNSGSSSCSGSIQLSTSEENFSSCIGLGSVTASNSNKTFTINPSSTLASSSAFKIRMTTDAKTSNGGISVVARTYSFTTGDFLGPVITSINPDNASAAVATGLDNITLIFNETATEASVTVNTSDTTCSGYSIQLSSSSSFTSCVQISSLTSRYDNDTQFELGLSSELEPLAKYYLKLTTGITDSSGNSGLQKIYEFTMNGALYFHTSGSDTGGNLGDRSTTNSTCSANKPAWTTTSIAFISYTGGDSISDLPSTASVPTSYNIKWYGDNDTVSDNFTDLYTATAGSTGGIDARFDLKTGWDSGAGAFFTGSSTDGTVSAANCSDWTSADSSRTATRGIFFGFLNRPDWINAINLVSCEVTNAITFLCLAW